VETKGPDWLGDQACLFLELASQASERVLAPIEASTRKGPVIVFCLTGSKAGEQNTKIGQRDPVHPDSGLPTVFIDQHDASMPKSPSVGRYEPMLATPWARPFDDPDWWFEVKWDGYRTIAYCTPDRTELRSRRGNDVGPRFPEVASMRLERPAVLDGEIVTFDDKGAPSFFLLGQRPANIVIFDVLYLDRDVCGLPFEQRRQLLESLMLPTPAVLSQPVREDGTALFEAVGEKGMEGVVGKKAGSLYHPGRRSPDWRKIIQRLRGRAVVGGYLAGEGARADTFGSLLLGLWDGPDLRFVGSVGTGFDHRLLMSLTPQLASIVRPVSPFSNPVDVPGHKVFVEPQIVVEIEYREWTPYHRIRAPVFKGFSIDPPETATWELEGPGSP
jgi:bifunctional non-homologous end joining protein LigD